MNDAAALTGLDAVLWALRDSPAVGPDGLSDHRPMVAETLEHLGYPQRIVVPTAPTGTGAGRCSVSQHGEVPRLADGDLDGWAAHWAVELCTRDLDAVMAEALTQLADGVVTTAGHALLRTHHALRSYRRTPSSLRRDELAYALGTWSALYMTLDGAEPCGTAPCDVVLDAVAPDATPGGGLISDHLAACAARIGDLAAGAALDADPGVACWAVASAGFSVLHPHPGATAVVHAATVPVAAAALCAHTDTTTGRRLAVGCWRLAVGLRLLYGAAPVPAGRRDLDRVVRAAVDSGDTHAIKLAGAAVDATGHLDTGRCADGLTQYLLRRR